MDVIQTQSAHQRSSRRVSTTDAFPRSRELRDQLAEEAAKMTPSTNGATLVNRSEGAILLDQSNRLAAQRRRPTTTDHRGGTPPTGLTPCPYTENRHGSPESLIDTDMVCDSVANDPPELSLGASMSVLLPEPQCRILPRTQPTTVHRPSVDHNPQHRFD